MKELDASEDVLVERFERHPVLAGDGVNRSRFCHPHLVPDAKARSLAREPFPGGGTAGRAGQRVPAVTAADQ